MYILNRVNHKNSTWASTDSDLASALCFISWVDRSINICKQKIISFPNAIPLSK